MPKRKYNRTRNYEAVNAHFRNSAGPMKNKKKKHEDEWDVDEYADNEEEMIDVYEKIVHTDYSLLGEEDELD